MMYALRDKIRARWEKMGITDKKNDPIKELVVIAEPDMTEAFAGRYIEALGLAQYVDVVMAGDLQSRLSEFGKEYRIGVRTTAADKLDYAALSGAGSVILELGQINGEYIDTNSYEAVFELLARPRENLERLVADGEFNNIGISRYERGVFIYVPRAIPHNYNEEIRQHREALKLLLSAA